MPRASRGPRPGPDHPCRAHHASGWPRSTCAGSGRLPLGGTGAWGSEATLHRPGRPDPRGASQKGQLRQNQPDWLPPGLSQQGPCACGGGGRVPLSLSSPLGLSSQASNATHHNYLSCRAHSCKDLTKKPARTTTKPARTTHTCALGFPFHPAKVSAVYSPPSAPCDPLVLEVLHQVLHVPQLRVQAAPLAQDAVQLSPEVVDVLLKQGLQVLPHGLGALLLEQSPLGVQDLVLLLQEPHLERAECEGGET